MNSQDILNCTETYLQKFVAPQAEIIDTNSEALATAIDGLEARSLLALRVPQYWGGLDIDPETFDRHQESIARYSGALWFLQAQHHSATSMLAASDNEMLKNKDLPAIARGELRLGVGFSHLRRSGNPVVTATPAKDGYLLSGTIPWVTGLGLFHKFILAATLPDDRAVFGMVPFANFAGECGTITCSEPMELISMSSTKTVTATLDNYLLHESQIISLKPAGWIAESDRKNVLKSIPATLGCIRAGLDAINSVASSKNSPAISAASHKLEEKFDRLKTNFNQAENCSFAEELALRAEAIDLAMRCGQAAVTVSAGAANSITHAAGRIYREALVYTVTGQTKDVMAATLDRILNS
ncbi:MAG: acyl-CoA/acyl-ACP dehydrogenase [Richelia sp. CSU_2_1]|nr:acyl-CoA/acyl-ACP dehydrogenase [Microcoleus sp. SU_5_6]NJL66459.1 acyl-CoA/acyl-ACP dehydrogenase [Microcoleus sp. SM1_3_4]NJR21458.1 acyl-CoA/acyl-ACP dehydrogenase [Richelia sp. CSU_2_1]